MNEQNFTYSGVTVSYSEEQKAILLADQNLITQLKAQLIAHQNEYIRIEGIISEAKNQLDNECNKLSGFGGKDSPKQKCIDYNNGIWNAAIVDRGIVSDRINANATQQASAVKKLNDDILTIQNDIKLQIQTQLSNTAAQTAAAQNEANVITAPANAAASAAATQTELMNQAATAKLKQEQTIKIVGFILLAVVVITIGYFIFKKVLS